MCGSRLQSLQRRGSRYSHASARLVYTLLAVLLVLPVPSLSTDEPARILTVGDGSFSFSASLRARLDRMEGAFHLTATSFDSRASVLDKYPESRTLIPRLAKHSSVEVMHNVDATGLEGSDVVRLGPFDLIIWNFPHSGTEDCRRHCALVAHFFASCTSILRRRGQVQVALANEQPSLWRVEELARRAGLIVVEARPFEPEAEFPGYTPRRHHAETSFQRRGPAREKMRARRFTFTAPSEESKGAASPEATESAVWLPAANVQMQMEGASTSRYDTAPEELVAQAGKRSTGDKPLWLQHSEARDGVATAKGGGGSFVGQGGVGQETRSGTLMPTGDKTGSKNSAGRLACSECAKDFGDRVALEQHRAAKHGRHRDIKPDWAGRLGDVRCLERPAPISHSGASPSSTRHGADEAQTQWWCEVCCMWWWGEAEHQRSLQPVERVQHRCECGRSFLSSRALLQHSNFCSSRLLEMRLAPKQDSCMEM